VGHDENRYAPLLADTSTVNDFDPPHKAILQTDLYSMGMGGRFSQQVLNRTSPIKETSQYVILPRGKRAGNGKTKKAH
jgi:hypothetical protein